MLSATPFSAQFHTICGRASLCHAFVLARVWLVLLAAAYLGFCMCRGCLLLRCSMVLSVGVCVLRACVFVVCVMVWVLCESPMPSASLLNGIECVCVCVACVCVCRTNVWATGIVT